MPVGLGSRAWHEEDVVADGVGGAASLVLRPAFGKALSNDVSESVSDEKSLLLRRRYRLMAI